MEGRDMKIYNVILTAVMLIFLSMSLPLTVTASGEEWFTITVVKYSLPIGQYRDDIPVSGEINVITGADGSSLYRLPGVSFRVIRVENINGTYVPVVGEYAYYREETSDENGLAVFDQLPRGIYMVIVLEHPELEILDEPVIIHLPLRNQDGTYLYNVHIFPKSRLNCEYYGTYTPGGPGDDNGDDNGDGTINQPPTPPNRLPQTAGSIGSITFLLVGLVVVTILGGYGMYTLKKKGI